MIQTVGIRFEAQGITEITGQMKVLGRSINSLVTAVKQLENMNTSTAIANLNRLANGMGNAASKLSLAAQEINAAVASFTGANAAIGRGRPAGANVTGSESIKGAKDRSSWWGGWDSEKTNFARIGKNVGFAMGLFEAINLGRELASASVGGTRSDLIDPMLNLHAIGYKTAAEKRQAEIDAANYSRMIRGDVSTTDILKARAEMGSAIPHDDPKAPALTRDTHKLLAEQATALGRLSQMTPQAAAGLLESMLSGYYYMGSPQTKNRMRNESGYITEMSGNMAGQMYRAIDIFKLKGQDISEFMKYMTPSMIEKGWDFPTMVALAGMGSSMGFRTNQQGRGTKTLLEARPEQLGGLLLAGSEDKAVSAAYRDMKASEKKKAGLAEFRKYENEFRTDLVGWLTERLSPARLRAQSYGYNMKDFSGSDFMPLFTAMSNPEFLKSLSESLQTVRDTKMGAYGLQKEHQGAVGQDSAWLPKEFNAAWDRFTKSIGDAVGPVSTLTQGLTGMGAGILNFLAKWQEWTNKFNREKGISGWVQEKAEGASRTIRDWWRSGLPVVDYLKFAENRDQMALGSTQMLSGGLYGKNNPFGHWQGNMMSTLHGLPFAPPQDKGIWQGSNMSMFKVPQISQDIPQATHTVNVHGTGEVTVWIKQDGKPDQKETAPLTFKNSTGNSTSRGFGGYKDQAPADY